MLRASGNLTPGLRRGKECFPGHDGGVGILERAQKSRPTDGSKEIFPQEFFSAPTLKRQREL